MISCDSILTVNRLQVEAMKQTAERLRPQDEDSCKIFGIAVRNVQAALIHTYQIIASEAIRDADPAEAAKRWEYMEKFCDQALKVLKAYKDIYPYCGTPELYNLALDYRLAATDRLNENTQDAEWLKTHPTRPAGLFQPVS